MGNYYVISLFIFSIFLSYLDSHSGSVLCWQWQEVDFSFSHRFYCKLSVEPGRSIHQPPTCPSSAASNRHRRAVLSSPYLSPAVTIACWHCVSVSHAVNTLLRVALYLSYDNFVSTRLGLRTYEVLRVVVVVLIVLPCHILFTSPYALE